MVRLWPDGTSHDATDGTDGLVDAVDAGGCCAASSAGTARPRCWCAPTTTSSAPRPTRPGWPRSWTICAPG
ncbi:hypothetical protein NKH77_34100 [Streptomyces sp. M19]